VGQDQHRAGDLRGINRIAIDQEFTAQELVGLDQVLDELAVRLPWERHQVVESAADQSLALPGLRLSVGMSDSSEDYPEGGDGSGRVASVVAEGSGEVDDPARLSTPIARLRRPAMMCGPVPVPTWEASSAKGDVAHPVPRGLPVQTANGLVQCAADH
jgi:hypothetical protein